MWFNNWSEFHVHGKKKRPGLGNHDKTHATVPLWPVFCFSSNKCCICNTTCSSNTGDSPLSTGTKRMKKIQHNRPRETDFKVRFAFALFFALMVLWIMVYEKLHWVLSLGIDIMGILRRLAFIEMNYFGGGAERRANLFKSKCGRTEGDEILCCAQDFKYTHKHIILSILLDMIQTHTIVEFELFCLADGARTRGQCCHIEKKCYI